MRTLGFFNTVEILVGNKIALAIFKHITNPEACPSLDGLTTHLGNAVAFAQSDRIYHSISALLHPAQRGVVAGLVIRLAQM